VPPALVNVIIAPDSTLSITLLRSTPAKSTWLKTIDEYEEAVKSTIPDSLSSEPISQSNSFASGTEPELDEDEVLLDEDEELLEEDEVLLLDELLDEDISSLLPRMRFYRRG
jgi:hypothetical protein